MNLDDLLSQAQERQRQQQAAIERQQRDEQERYCANLQMLLDQVIPRTIQEQVGMAIRFHSQHQGALAWFDVEGTEYYIAQDRGRWYIGRPNSADRKHLAPDDVLDALALTIAEARQIAAQQRAREAELEQRRRDLAAQAEVNRQRRERAAEEQQQRHAALLAEHERCVPIVAAQVAQAQRTAWRWPEGREITLYVWRWQAGKTEDGADYDSGYSTQDRLDADGWVVINGTRRIRLIPEVHLPIVQAETFSATAQLPPQLKESAHATIRGIGYNHELHAPDDDGDDVPAYREQPNGTISVYLGEQPKAWVRALIDA